MTRFGDDAEVIGADVRRQLGHPRQLVSVERLVHAEGPAAGAGVLVVRNPRGISFEVTLDKAMDIGWADAPGLPLAWCSSRGPVSSARHEPQGAGWTRTFSGGLLTTCGLASTGSPSTIDARDHGLHGRVGNIPVENVRWGLTEIDGEAWIEITGQVVEASLDTETLLLRRRIQACTMRAELRIEDTVTNESWVEAGHMFRHHLNLGYPVVTQGTQVTSSALPFGMREEGTIPDFPWTLDLQAEGEAPPVEEVIYCKAPLGEKAVTTTLTGPDGTWIEVKQEADDWPLLVLWRDARSGVNVLGVEPSTSRDGGRAQAERDGEVITLLPGESRRYRTVIRAGTRC